MMKKRYARRSVIGLASLLLLAGCGRKGGLELPPREEPKTESSGNEEPAAESETIE